MNNMYIPFLTWRLIANISITFGVAIFVLCMTFCWYQWKLVKVHWNLPSVRLEAKAFLLFTLGRHRRDVPITTVIFQMLLNAAKTFQNEGLCMLWFLKPWIFVYSEEHMKYLVNEVDLANKALPYEINNRIFGNGLVGSKHEVWKLHRKLLDPAFNLAALKNKIPSMNKNALQLAEKLKTVVDKPIDDVWEHLKYCAYQNMADSVLGLKQDDEKHVAYSKDIMQIVDQLGEQFVARLLYPWLYWDLLLPLFPAGRKYLKDVDMGERLIREVMNELSAEEQNIDTTNSCGNILINLHHRDPSFTERDVLDHLANFTSAGYDTVAVTMLWCFYTLGHYPQVQEKAYREVQIIVPDGDVTYDALAKLKYLDCVIKETLRLYPSVPLFGRKAAKDIKCGQYTIPKGAEVGFFTFLLHRNPNVFPEPEKFDPERFWDNTTLRPWMFLPFAEGYRNCIGKKFALLEIKAQLVHVLRRFRITSLDKVDDADLDWNVILKPAKSVRFLFGERHSKT